jgi:hypothetical protein
VAGFAEVSVGFFPSADGNSMYTVVAVVEQEDAARVRYRTTPPEAGAPPLAAWAEGLPAAKDSTLFQAAVLTYGHFLDGKPENAREVTRALGQDPAKVKAVRELLKARSAPKDCDLALRPTGRWRRPC